MEGIRYEKLLDLCVICGMFGHVAKDCAYYDEDMPESMYPYGAWLRASPTRSREKGGLGIAVEEGDWRKGLHAAEGDWRRHWLCAGDFNQFLYKEEKTGGPMREQNLLDDFKLALEDCGLLDLGYIDFPYTWWNGRDGCQIVHERLDRMLGNSEWLCYFPLLSVYHLNWGDSDHVPVKLTEYKGGKKERRRGKGFKFEDFSLTSNACGAVVEEAWGEGCGVGVDVVPYRLGVVSAALKRWSKKEFGSIQEQLKNKRSLPSDDVLVWHYSSNGESYTTKSGYRFIRWFKVNMNQASSSTSSSFLWKKTWSLVLLPKVKVFLWRSCRKALPTRANRISGKPRQCAQCDRTEENVLHALFLCLVVQGVCESISVDMSRVMDPPNERFNEWWEKILKLFTDEEICKIAMICWGLWDARNKSIFEVSAHGNRLQGGCVKLNCDAGRVGDEGVVARDEHGEVLVAAVNQIEARWEPRVAEAKDVLYAIKVALFSGFDNIVVETDCLDVIKHLQEGLVSLSSLGLVTRDIKRYCSYFSFIIRTCLVATGSYFP
ncbi:Neuron navigator 3 [Bienertia sinuspersici]